MAPHTSDDNASTKAPQDRSSKRAPIIPTTDAPISDDRGAAPLSMSELSAGRDNGLNPDVGIKPVVLLAHVHRLHRHEDPDRTREGQHRLSSATPAPARRVHRRGRRARSCRRPNALRAHRRPCSRSSATPPPRSEPTPPRANPHQPASPRAASSCRTSYTGCPRAARTPDASTRSPETPPAIARAAPVAHAAAPPDPVAPRGAPTP